MATLTEIVIIVCLLAILYTLREILHFTKLTLFKIARQEQTNNYYGTRR